MSRALPDFAVSMGSKKSKTGLRTVQSLLKITVDVGLCVSVSSWHGMIFSPLKQKPLRITKRR
jgi:hypothetical protein